MNRVGTVYVPVQPVEAVNAVEYLYCAERGNPSNADRLAWKEVAHVYYLHIDEAGTCAGRRTILRSPPIPGEPVLIHRLKYSLAPRPDLIPAGSPYFDWGSPGAANLRLATALLAHATGNGEWAVRFAQYFRAVIESLPYQQPWTLRQSTILRALGCMERGDGIGLSTAYNLAGPIEMFNYFDSQPFGTYSLDNVPTPANNERPYA